MRRAVGAWGLQHLGVFGTHRPQPDLSAQTYLLNRQEIQEARQMKRWKERLEKKYYSTEIQDDYQPVTQQEFRE